MRDYGKVHTTFWSSKTMASVGDDARLLALYLLTCAHTHMSGVFRLPDAYGCEDLGWSSERLRNGFKALSDVEWLERCESTGWLRIVKFPKFNRPDNGNQQKAIDKHLALVPDDCSFASKIRVGETVSEPVPNLPTPTPTPIPTPKKAAKPKAVATAMPADFGVSERVTAWAKREGFDRLEEHCSAFKRKVAAKGYTYASWDDAFMEAIREDWAKLRGRPANGAAPPAPDSRPGGGRAYLG